MRLLRSLISLIAIVVSQTTFAVSFIAISDMPYNPVESAMLDGPNGPLFKAIKQQPYDFIFHLGDIKSGGAPCDDERILYARDQIAAIDAHKTVYTPGDNEWTDCDRFGADELERLAFLKTTFYGQQSAIKPKLHQFTQQTDAIENALWQVNDVGFASLHIPGTNFGRDQISVGEKAKALAQADSREQQVIAWLDTVFTQHHAAKAIVLGFHADLFAAKHYKKPECSPSRPSKCDAYKRIRAAMRAHIERYKKPVLLMHGDTKAVCMDHISLAANANVWRINTAGDTVADVMFIKVNVENSRPFHVEMLLSAHKPLKTCENPAKL